MSFDAYLLIDGIPGESTDDAHPEWIQVLSYNHGVIQPPSSASGTGGRTGGRADFQEFSFVKTLDAATPDLAIYCASGKHIPSIEVELCLATGDKHTFMKYIMEDCVISGVRPGGSSDGGETRPLEDVSFVYGKIKWEYTPIDQTGAAGSKIDRTWNLETNKQE